MMQLPHITFQIEANNPIRSQAEVLPTFLSVAVDPLPAVSSAHPNWELMLPSLSIANDTPPLAQASRKCISVQSSYATEESKVTTQPVELVQRI